MKKSQTEQAPQRMEDFNEPLDWMKIVERPIPEYRGNEGRNALRADLHQYVLALTNRYCTRESDQFPSDDELKKLLKLCEALARLLGKTKFEFGQLHSAVKLIEQRYTKIPIIDFFDKLLNKLVRIEAPPCTVVHNALQDPKKKEAEREVLSVLKTMLQQRDEWEPGIDSRPWDKWLDVIKPLKLIAEPLLTFIEASDLSSDQKKLVGYFVVMNLLRQQLMWMHKYGVPTRPTVAYFIALSRECDQEKLRTILHGDAPRPRELPIRLAKLKNRARRIRSYRNKHPKAKS